LSNKKQIRTFLRAQIKGAKDDVSSGAEAEAAIDPAVTTIVEGSGSVVTGAGAVAGAGAGAGAGARAGTDNAVASEAVIDFSSDMCGEINHAFHVREGDGDVDAEMAGAVTASAASVVVTS
jgi:hypothetical protein